MGEVVITDIGILSICGLIIIAFLIGFIIGYFESENKKEEKT